ncbi:hypothetical protein CEP51_014090 [Fusarium floridanum]|uniref:Prion-inhibition and propagation HeLo domain-containing protein n=1 Tax=Fusarium floridanum TaxID=1325733 RepID=A0A428PZC5_9HYPO|nr:hypothetical protein CEP51_014090 [Fusarium floridanum]
MESAGLVIGVAGLAGLFNSCLEAVDKVQSYQTFGTDSHVLDTRFKAAKTRFERWGLGVGIKQGKLLPNYHPVLDDNDTSVVVTDLLCIIVKAICDASNAPQRRTRATGPDVDDSSGLHEPGLPFAAASRSRRGKMSWALWGKRGRVEQVELFEKLVQELHNLGPLQVTRGLPRYDGSSLGSKAKLEIVSRHEGAFEYVRQKWEFDSDPIATRSTVISLFTQLLHAIPGCTITRLGEWEKHRAFALLRWTVFALRPLIVCEITEAVLIVEFEDLPLDDLPDAVDDDYVDSEIIGLCGPLLEVRNDPADPSVGRRTIHLPHFTVRQFLLRQLPTPDWIQQNDRLQISYEKYVSLRQVWGDGSYDPPPLGLSLRSYAATAWHRHVHLGVRNEAEVAKLCIKFLDLDNPNWEAWRSLIEPGKVGQGNKEAEAILPGPLYYAIKLHLNDVAIALVTEQSANESSSLGRSPLGVACANGCIDVVDALLKKGADLTVSNRDRWTPLHAASYNGHEHVVDLLLDRGCTADLRDKTGRTPLSFAAEKGHESIVRRLLATNGVDVNSRRVFYPKSVFYGVWVDDKEVAKLLFPVDDNPSLGYAGSILSSADPNHISLDDIFTALSHLSRAEVEAIKSGQTSVLLTAPDISNKVELVLARDVSVTTGTTPLHLAAQNGHATVVETLLEVGGIATEPVDESNHTPLLLAAAAGHEAVVRLLLGADGVNPNFMDWDYQTPLSLAVRYGHEAVTKLLLDNGNGTLQDEVRKRT